MHNKEDQQNPLQILTDAIRETYGPNDEFIRLTQPDLEKARSDGVKRFRLEKRIRIIMGEAEKLKFGSETIEVKTFYVADEDFMTQTPKGWINSSRVPIRPVMMRYMQNFLEWLYKKLPEETRIVSGKSISEGFNPTQPLIQYTSV